MSEPTILDATIAMVSAMLSEIKHLRSLVETAQREVVLMAQSKVGEHCEHHRLPLVTLEYYAMRECPLCWKAAAEEASAELSRLRAVPPVPPPAREDHSPYPDCPRCHGTGQCSNAQFSCICRWHRLDCALVQSRGDCDCRKVGPPTAAQESTHEETVDARCGRESNHEKDTLSPPSAFHEAVHRVQTGASEVEAEAKFLAPEPSRPETPDFEQIALRVPVMSCEACAAKMRRVAGGLHYDDARGGATWGVCRTIVAEQAIVEQLRLVWNARGAADIAMVRTALLGTAEQEPPQMHEEEIKFWTRNPKASEPSSAALEVIEWLKALRTNALMVNDGHGQPLADRCTQALKYMEGKK